MCIRHGGCFYVYGVLSAEQVAFQVADYYNGSGMLNVMRDGAELTFEQLPDYLFLDLALSTDQGMGRFSHSRK